MVLRAVERFASDGVLVLGGARAILLQVADPVVAAGVARHSDFAHRPVERLRNTLRFAYAVVLGTPEDAAAVTTHVNRAHRPVNRAEDAELQLWVAATLYDTAALVHERVFGATADALADEVYHDYAALGTSLQMPADLWPADRADFARYRDARVAGLLVTDEARQIAHDLFAPLTAPAWLRAGLPLARLLTIDLLPAALRDAYGFDWTARSRCRARRAWGVIRILARVTPHRLRAWPYRHYLRRLRAPA
ncbi:MAG: oxygenase MpaB family protein [Galbitalea sp.]